MATPPAQKPLEKYLSLMVQHPELFSPRTHRRIVRDREVLRKTAEEDGLRIGLLAETEYTYFLNDLVETTGEDGVTRRYPYQRIVYRKQLDGAINTVVFAVIEDKDLGNVGDVVLVEQERHATGQIHRELPRGFGEKGISPEANALNELREETGYIGRNAAPMGASYTDTGMMDCLVRYYHVPVVGKVEPERSPFEPILNTCLVPPDRIEKEIRSGIITDGFTIQGISFYRLFLKGTDT
jgi:ADP-ribose pyrophosphatase